MPLLLVLGVAVQAAHAAAAPHAALCAAPAPLSRTAPNILLIGDSVSMGSFGYAQFVQDVIQTASNGTLAAVQHGGGYGGGGQMASTADGAQKVSDCMGNHSGTLPPKAWAVVTYNSGLHDW